MKPNFKSTYSVEDRHEEATRIIKKYPDRIPVICERLSNAGSDCPYIDKNKYLVPGDLSIGQFMYVIRRRMNLPADKAIFLFINGTIPASFQSLYSIYDIHKDQDKFLYILYAFENTFG